MPSDVLAMLGHELWAPLATLRATLELLAELPAVGTDAAGRELYPRLERSVRWLERLVDNLTATALARSGHLALQCAPVALDDALSGAIGLLQPLLERREQRVLVLCPSAAPWVVADPVWLGQVLVNLLVNASTYGPLGGRITIGVTARDRDVEVRVRDQGPGIPTREQASIFRPYARGRAGRDGPVGGLGLGLHVVRTLVHLHGGRVGVRSAPGRGATFWFRLPTDTAPTDHTP